MEKITNFIAKFCDMKLENVHKIGRRYYQANSKLIKITDSINRDVFHIGTFLGETKQEFKPSLELLSMISKKSKRKVFLNEKGEWMFQCKRDVFEENIVKSNIQKGICLVENSYNENIGYGTVFGKKLKPILDRGDFLRREG